jgi:hypothetical protein
MKVYPTVANNMFCMNCWANMELWVALKVLQLMDVRSNSRYFKKTIVTNTWNTLLPSESRLFNRFSVDCYSYRQTFSETHTDCRKYRFIQDLNGRIFMSLLLSIESVKGARSLGCVHTHMYLHQKVC